MVIDIAREVKFDEFQVVYGYKKSHVIAGFFRESVAFSWSHNILKQ